MDFKVSYYWHQNKIKKKKKEKENRVQVSIKWRVKLEEFRKSGVQSMRAEKVGLWPVMATEAIIN